MNHSIANLVIDCCNVKCIWRSRLINSSSDDTIMLPDEVVQFKCTKCGDPVMCSECYDRDEERIIKDVKSHMKISEVKKTLWTTKYDMTMRHMCTTCICGGKLRAILNGREVLRKSLLDTNANAPPSPGKKKKKTPKAYEITRFQDNENEDEEDDLDEDQLQYLYKRQPDSNDNVDLSIDALFTDDLTDDLSYPEMPPRTLPQVKRFSSIRSEFQPPPITIKDWGTYLTLTITSHMSQEWMRRIIGTKGAGLKRIISGQAKNGVNITRIWIDETPDRAFKRIFVYGKYSDHRQVCALALQEDILGILKKTWKP